MTGPGEGGSQHPIPLEGAAAPPDDPAAEEWPEPVPGPELPPEDNPALDIPPTKVTGNEPPPPDPLSWGLGQEDVREPNNTKWWAAVMAAAILVVVGVITFTLVATGGNKAKPPLRPPADTVPAPLHSSAVPPPVVGSPGLIIPTNQMSFTGDICQTGGLLHLIVALRGIAPASSVRMDFTGPGLPQTLTFTANPGETFGTNFPVHGAGQWSDTVVSVNGKPVSSSLDGSHEGTSWQC